MSSNNNEIDYVAEIFPHLAGSRDYILKDISRAVWELINKGYVKTTRTNVTLRYFKLLKYIPKKEVQSFIQKIKRRVALINSYKIRNTYVILSLLIKNLEPSVKEYSLSDLKLIQELARDPMASLDTLVQRTGLSKSWIVNRKKELLEDKAIIVKSAIDMKYFGLKYKSYVFMVKKEKEEIFLNLIQNVPYVTRMLKIYDYYRVNPTFIYLITIFIPKNAEELYTRWISSFLRYQVIEDFYVLEFHTMGHCLNLEMFDTKDWVFDVDRAGLYSFYFLKEYRDITPITKNLRLFKFQDKTTNKFEFAELYIAAMLEHNPYFTLKEIQQNLIDRDIPISLGKLHQLKNRMMKHLFPIAYLSKSGLNASFTVYIWQPNISDEEIDFLIKYFANHYPQTYIFISNDGFYATIEVPTRDIETVKETLTLLQDVYYDVILFDKAYTRGARSFGSLLRFWDKERKKWTVDEWMLPSVRDTVRNFME